jgi:aryl-alcohol dehydrogenase-like predicted oxidoreductase
MEYGQIAGVEKPVSRLVMGSMVLNSDRIPASYELLDDYRDHGGNAIDTAFVYGGGKSEPAVGSWITERGIREEIVVIAKGAATTDCTPELVTREMLESLDRLGLDYVDVYLMHRDNVDIPVGEFVDCLNGHREAGRIHAYGGSNWSIARLQEVYDYAASKSVPAFAASSPSFSLANWNEPMWGGCLNATDPESRAWYAQTQMPLLAWSSQASGFFTGRYQKDNPDANREVARVWFNDGNWERLRRAGELGAQKDVTALQIALAYVLDQPDINIFALIGPQNVDELATSVVAVDVLLTPAELRWLNLEE